MYILKQRYFKAGILTSLKAHASLLSLTLKLTKLKRSKTLSQSLPLPTTSADHSEVRKQLNSDDLKAGAGNGQVWSLLEFSGFQSTANLKPSMVLFKSETLCVNQSCNKLVNKICLVPNTSHHVPSTILHPMANERPGLPYFMWCFGDAGIPPQNHIAKQKYKGTVWIKNP